MTRSVIAQSPEHRTKYRYDQAGNVQYRTNFNLLHEFKVDSLNQLTNVSRPPSSLALVVGSMAAETTNVTVSGTGLVAGTATRYGDRTWARYGAMLADGSNTFTAVATDAAGRSDTNTLVAYLPSSVNLVYDANGNLRTNGQQVLEYDDENRLVTHYVAGAWKTEHVYDGKSRRRIERNYTWSGGAWQLTGETRFIYGGNLVLQHRTAENQPRFTVTRGRDLSGSFTGAGGIGGLLALTDHSSTASQLATSLYHADGNGNITYLVSTNGLVTARYWYDPYGAMLAHHGPLALINPYRFSSKPVHELSGMYDYLYRWYAPELQRWVNKDPIGEDGGFNVHRFVQNNAMTSIDSFGLTVWKCTRVSDFGIGRHSYLWDDRPGPRVHSCGMGGVNGLGPTTDSDDTGPVKIGGSIAGPEGPFMPVTIPWQSGDATCIPIPGTSGDEDGIMSYCESCINRKISWYTYLPPINDCHNACDSVLRDLGLDAPGMDKLNSWEIDALSTMTPY